MKDLAVKVKGEPEPESDSCPPPGDEFDGREGETQPLARRSGRP